MTTPAVFALALTVPAGLFLRKVHKDKQGTRSKEEKFEAHLARVVGAIRMVGQRPESPLHEESLTGLTNRVRRASLALRSPFRMRQDSLRQTWVEATQFMAYWALEGLCLDYKVASEAVYTSLKVLPGANLEESVKREQELRATQWKAHLAYDALYDSIKFLCLDLPPMFQPKPIVPRFTAQMDLQT